MQKNNVYILYLSVLEALSTIRIFFAYNTKYSFETRMCFSLNYNPCQGHLSNRAMVQQDQVLLRDFQLLSWFKWSLKMFFIVIP